MSRVPSPTRSSHQVPGGARRQPGRAPPGSRPGVPPRPLPPSDGKAARARLAQRAHTTGIETGILAPGQDLAALAGDAAAAGADALGMARGDGSLAVVAAVAAAHRIPFAPEPVHAGVDGEAVELSPPLRFAIRPAALRVRASSRHPGVSPSARLRLQGHPLRSQDSPGWVHVTIENTLMKPRWWSPAPWVRPRSRPASGRGGQQAGTGSPGQPLLRQRQRALRTRGSRSLADVSRDPASDTIRPGASCGRCR